MKEKVILKTLVGSRAHGLDNEDSDWDYRGVYVEPTEKILSIGHKYKGTHWLEDEGCDQTAYEIGHFLKLATKSNPSILEVFVAPIVDATETGRELRNLFPYIWSAKDAYNAFRGYGKNQRKKFFNETLPHERKSKYACAWLRTTYNLYCLLKEGFFNLSVVNTPIYNTLKEWKRAQFSKGEVVNVIDYWENLASKAFNKNPANFKKDWDKVNQFLIKVRKENFEKGENNG